MKAKHWVITGFIVVGALYVWHMWSSHGSFKSAAAGLGINR
jgi:hypothetical protein